MLKSNDILNVAIVGSGFGLREILPVLSAIEKVKIHVKKSSTRDSIIENSQNVSIRTFEEICSDEEIDLVIIAVPPFLQRQYVEKFAQNHKAIYLEKPGGINSVEAKEIEQIAIHNECTIYIGFQYRFDPGIIYLSNQIASVSSVNRNFRVEVLWKIKQELDVTGWKRNLDLGGGVYRDYLCHVSDYLINSIAKLEKNVLDNFEFCINPENMLDSIQVMNDRITIKIERNPELETFWQILYEDSANCLGLRAKYPFQIQDYEFYDGESFKPLKADLLIGQLPNPHLAMVSDDCRKIALQQYFFQIINDLSGKNKTNDAFIRIPKISDAVRTQMISDKIYLPSRY